MWTLVLLRRICCSVSSLQGSISSTNIQLALEWSSPGASGNCLLCHGPFSPWAPLCSMPEALPSYFSLTLEFPVFFLTFFPFLNCACTEAPPAPLVSSAVSCSGYIAEQPWLLLADSIPAAIPRAKTLSPTPGVIRWRERASEIKTRSTKTEICFVFCFGLLCSLL